MYVFFVLLSHSQTGTQKQAQNHQAIKHIFCGWWFQPFRKILVIWDDYSLWKNKICSKPPTSFVTYSIRYCGGHGPPRTRNFRKKHNNLVSWPQVCLVLHSKPNTKLHGNIHIHPDPKKKPPVRRQMWQWTIFIHLLFLDVLFPCFFH